MQRITSNNATITEVRLKHGHREDRLGSKGQWISMDNREKISQQMHLHPSLTVIVVQHKSLPRPDHPAAKKSKIV